MTLVMLAHNYIDQDPTGYWMSEKMDGMRAFWDGGITRGYEKHTVPWSHKTRPYDLSTGLWSRYGNPIYAPDWWLDGLPKNHPLDGELWIDRSFRQDLLSILKRNKPSHIDWGPVRLFAFDTPTIKQILTPRVINLPNHKADLTDTYLWQKYNIPSNMPTAPISFDQTITQLIKLFSPLTKNTWRPVTQIKCTGKGHLTDFHNQILKVSGEGVMLRHPFSSWEPKRSANLLKVKQTDTDVGIVIGYNAGQGKYLGMLGSLILQVPEGILELSGFTNKERRLNGSKWAKEHPGERLPSYLYSTKFPLGSTVRFIYRGRNKSGLPNEARYKR